MFAVDHAGEKVNYDKNTRTNSPANLFRIWFTSAGTGFGLRLATKKAKSTNFSRLVWSVTQNSPPHMQPITIIYG